MNCKYAISQHRDFSEAVRQKKQDSKRLEVQSGRAERKDRKDRNGNYKAELKLNT